MPELSYFSAVIGDPFLLFPRVRQPPLFRSIGVWIWKEPAGGDGIPPQGLMAAHLPGVLTKDKRKDVTFPGGSNEGQAGISSGNGTSLRSAEVKICRPDLSASKNARAWKRKRGTLIERLMMGTNLTFAETSLPKQGKAG